MEWINNFQLFLFDFDGLLVNTEEIHFQAYKIMLKNHGIDLNWDFPMYCQSAHYTSTKFREMIYESFSDLHKIPQSWEELYLEKQQIIIQLLHEGAVHLMPGVEQLLRALDVANIKRCVCTHSAISLVDVIREKNPILNTIPHWITRHDYLNPKPHPECYLTAIEKYAKSSDKVIGFEDSPRGLAALMETTAKPVLVSKIPYPEIPEFQKKGISCFSTFNDINVLQ